MALRIDINPSRDLRYVANATRYATLDMLLHSSPKARYVKSEKDLYHIETDRKGGYIEFAARQIYRAERCAATRGISTNLTFAFVDTNAVLVKKKDRENEISLSFFLFVRLYCSIASTPLSAFLSLICAYFTRSISQF